MEGYRRATTIKSERNDVSFLHHQLERKTREEKKRRVGERGGEKRGKEASITRVQLCNSRQAACAFDNTALPAPLSLYDPGLHSGGGWGRGYHGRIDRR